MSNGGGGQVVGGGIAVAALALLVEGVLAIVQRLVTPRALRTDRRRQSATAAVPAG
jgi:osmoprotectant transport system permease protein